MPRRRASPLILLPPSEGKAEGGGAPWDPAAGPFGGLARSRRRVARQLAVAMRDDRAVLERRLGVRGDGLDRAIAANRRLLRKPPALPAVGRFTGVVHGHLDLGGLPATTRRRAAEQVVYLSALCGLLAPGDPVPNHRLKMSVVLGGLGKLSTWWRPQLDAALAPLVEGQVVVDLLPQEHAAAVSPAPGAATAWVRARFEQRGSDGARKVIGHDAKAAKGLLARHLLEAGSADEEVLRGFRAGAWRFDEIEQHDDGTATVVVVRRA